MNKHDCAVVVETKAIAGPEMKFNNANLYKQRAKFDYRAAYDLIFT